MAKNGSDFIEAWTIDNSFWKGVKSQKKENY